MIEWQWVVTIALGSFTLGYIVGMVRVFLHYHKKTGKWMFEEESK